MSRTLKLSLSYRYLEHVCIAFGLLTFGLWRKTVSTENKTF